MPGRRLIRIGFLPDLKQMSRESRQRGVSGHNHGGMGQVTIPGLLEMTRPTNRMACREVTSFDNTTARPEFWVDTGNAAYDSGSGKESVPARRSAAEVIMALEFDASPRNLLFDYVAGPRYHS